jgi:hypothetical protein
MPDQIDATRRQRAGSLLAAIILLVVGLTQGVDYYWVGTNNALWSAASSWSSSSGGAGGTGVPAGNDTVVFDGG